MLGTIHWHIRGVPNPSSPYTSILSALPQVQKEGQECGKFPSLWVHSMTAHSLPRLTGCYLCHLLVWLVLPRPHKAWGEKQTLFQLFIWIRVTAQALSCFTSMENTFFISYPGVFLLHILQTNKQPYNLAKEVSRPDTVLSQSFTYVIYSPFVWHLHCTWENTRTQRDGLWGTEKHYLAREYSINFQQAAFIIHNIHLT